MKAFALLVRAALAMLAAPASWADTSAVYTDPCDGCQYPVDPSYPYPLPDPYPKSSDPGLYYGGDGISASNVQAGGDLVGTEEDFDILNLAISQRGDTLVVSILTRFIEDPNNSSIRYGDLMIATLSGWQPYGSAPFESDTAYNSGTQWNLVVDTSTGDLYQTSGWTTGTPNAGLNLSDDVPQDVSYKRGQYVSVDTTTATLVQSGAVTVTIDENVTLPDPLSGESPTPGTRLEYLIPVALLGIVGASPLDPAEIAVRWSMTCANDIVEGVGYIPEPATLALFLTGLAGLRLARRGREEAPGSLSG